MAIGKACACLVLIAACSSAQDPLTVVVPTTVDIQAFATTYCAKVSECAGAQTACNDQVVQQFNLDLKSTGYVVTSDGLKACTTALEATACGDVLSANVPSACIFLGTLADGITCTNDSECLSGACFVADGATCGKCGERAALGADCTTASCIRGAVCTAGKCAAPPNPPTFTVGTLRDPATCIGK